VNTWATQTKDEVTVQFSTLLSNTLFANFNSFVALMLIYCIDKFLPFISFHQFSLHSYGGKERISVYKANSEQKKMYFCEFLGIRSGPVVWRHVTGWLPSDVAPPLRSTNTSRMILFVFPSAQTTSKNFSNFLMAYLCETKNLYYEPLFRRVRQTAT
jgi:hypothetical protein